MESLRSTYLVVNLADMLSEILQSLNSDSTS